MAEEEWGIELQAHPFLEGSSVEMIDVLRAMHARKIYAVALQEYDKSIYPFVVDEVRKIIEPKSIDETGVLLAEGPILFNSREYSTKEGIHVLTVGFAYEARENVEIREVIDRGLERDALVVLAHPFTDNVKTWSMGHVSYEQGRLLEDLCKEYSGEIAADENGYCIPVVRRALKPLLEHKGHVIHYHDVNKRLRNFVKLDLRRHKLPIVATTDIHARTSKQIMRWLGQSRIVTEIEGSCSREMLSSLKEKIFSGEYKNIQRYVGVGHLAIAFGIPKVRYVIGR